LADPSSLSGKGGCDAEFLINFQNSEGVVAEDEMGRIGRG
jgi:hypothetical protein